jgi:peptidoglycan/xylan/chitin deacetylase (PgdA/CDA1 family)
LLVSSFLNNFDIYKEAAVSKVDKLYLPIIMYHHVKENGVGKDTITPKEFEADLKYLSENHYNTITMKDLLDYVNDNKLLPEKPIILTFDDGYLSTYKNVFPLLKKYNMKIVLSIIGKSTDAFSKVKDENVEYSHMSWNQLKEMLSSELVEVQNHTYNLHSYKGRVGCSQIKGECLNDYESKLREDLSMLQNEIKNYTGVVPNTLTYPYGAYNDNTIKIMKQVGIEAGLTCRYGINVVSRDMNLFELRRICRSHGVSVQKLLEKISKQLDIQI